MNTCNANITDNGVGCGPSRTATWPPTWMAAKPTTGPEAELDPVALWNSALDALEGDEKFPPDVIAGLRTAVVRWA